MLAKLLKIGLVSVGLGAVVGALALLGANNRENSADIEWRTPNQPSIVPATELSQGLLASGHFQPLNSGEDDGLTPDEGDGSGTTNGSATETDGDMPDLPAVISVSILDDKLSVNLRLKDKSVISASIGDEADGWRIVSANFDVVVFERDGAQRERRLFNHDGGAS